MTAPPPVPAAERAAYVNQMFAGIANRYDLLNRVMTGGQDVNWRREVVALSQLPDAGRLLDVGTGTGDIAFEAKRIHNDAEVIGCDFTYEMMAVGRKKKADHSPVVAAASSAEVEFVQGDGLNLPFPENYFDAVTSGFLLRNVTDADVCLAEQRRVLKPGGRIVCLETSPPPSSFLGPLLRLYLLNAIPLMGRLLSTGRSSPGMEARPRDAAYHYLSQTTVAFQQPEEIVRKMERAGFRGVSFHRKMMGTVAIHVGVA